MMTTKLFELVLNIKNIDFNEKNRRLDIYIHFKKGSLFNFENIKKGIKGDFKVHDTIKKTWRHLNFFEHECFLHARVPRVKLDDNSVKLINTPWEGKSNGFTLLFEALLLQLLSNMTVYKVSKIANVSDDKLWRMLKKYIGQALDDRNLIDISTIGIDETSIKKGHNYITLFVDLIKRKTIYITEGKDSNTIKDFKEDLEKNNGKIENIKNISCDMSPAFIKGVKENMPNAEITFDKFHIMKIINNAVNKVRMSEVKIEKIYF